ncbi:T9SS type A sorting domain-containing protein [Fibrivirga algicola]|uniref:T9SS type A sorting domain-containing protein n=1 Tax=Fibrivirga algicola TaxID=2950420 RepID=A0ABX0QHU1_9BACT|nr:T9SS type A sorting domain-containing protein [Fibrivirga algicola]NID11438.1 T9SS type A sorting domain-containing protein [Fibrivirga algicola]
MAHRLLLFLLVQLCAIGFCQAQTATNVTSNFTWVTTLAAEPLAVVADGPRGAYVLTKGNTIVLLDSKGRERWKQTFTDWPTIRRIATSPTGNLLVAGDFKSQFTIGDSTYSLGDASQSSTFVAQFDSTHTRRWITYVLTPQGLMSQAVSLGTDVTGSVSVFGRQTSTNVPFLCNFDSDGRFIQATTYGVPIIPSPSAVVAVADSRGGSRLGITERSRTSTFGLLVATDADTIQWRAFIDEALGAPTSSRSYDTAPVDLALDKADNLIALSSYTLQDRSIGLPIESGQALIRYDASGKKLWVKTGVSRSDSAVAIGLLTDQGGAFVAYGGYNGPYDQSTNQYGPSDYISLAGYAPNGSIRWSISQNAPTGTDRLISAARANNGALLLLGKTTGTLNLGTLSVTGTAAEPAYYLAQLQPFVLRPTAGPAVLCAGSSVPLSGTYTGHFEESPVLQLSDEQGNFSTPQVVGNVPIGVPGNLFNVSSFTLTVPLPGSLAAGTGYRLRAVAPLPNYIGDPLSVTVGVAPPIPAVAQAGDELVASTTATTNVSYQWYANNRQPVAGATNPRFRPTDSGAYYVVTMSGGCPSLPSEALNYVITATEPLVSPATVYPNPASGRIWVRWPTYGAAGQLYLTDLLGRTVRQQEQTGEVTELDISKLSAGVYLLTLRTEGQPAQVHKIWVR